jgi:hypothetical protein
MATLRAEAIARLDRVATLTTKSGSLRLGVTHAHRHIAHAHFHRVEAHFHVTHFEGLHGLHRLHGLHGLHRLHGLHGLHRLHGLHGLHRLLRGDSRRCRRRDWVDLHLLSTCQTGGTAHHAGAGTLNLNIVLTLGRGDLDHHPLGCAIHLGRCRPKPRLDTATGLLLLARRATCRGDDGLTPLITQIDCLTTINFAGVTHNLILARLS